MAIEQRRRDLHFNTNATSPKLCRIVLLPALRMSDGAHRDPHSCLMPALASVCSERKYLETLEKRVDICAL